MRVAAYLSATMMLVAAITGIGMLWVHLSHLRVDRDNHVLVRLWGTHGVHPFDLTVLAIELVLVLMLLATLIAGFSRRR